MLRSYTVNRFPPIFHHRSIQKKRIILFSPGAAATGFQKGAKNGYSAGAYGCKVLNPPFLVNFLDSEAKALEAIKAKLF